ncbi:hypothetical protein UA08_01233 [Talaromyces atroroseus]|uniref:Uncharacterized protein n=1 Tax=Talaromyces atroroseus TaxID=1441469 RepID=A0A1Q5QBM8_TALAT|nr:hypothetical protein UA08_01233 [Talaromyces atroroseus]OKL63169.1 hypothetical protein UA08_01233 [Talaromyces atroroseus]
MRDQFRRSPVTRPAMPTPSANSEKQNNGIHAKPFTPSLSAAFRTTAKSSLPLTPRLAHVGGYQTPKKSNASDTASPLPLPREDATTPDSTYLGTNITPRSGPRVSRRDGNAPSPETTPAAMYSGSQISRPTLPVSTGYARPERSPVRGNPRSEAAKSTTSKGTAADGLGLRASSRPQSSSESLGLSSSKFFHADDAHSSVGSYEAEPRPRTHSKPAQTSTFLYADGSHDRDSRSDDANKIAPSKRRSTGSSRHPVGAKSPPVLSPRLRAAQLVDYNSRSSSEGGLQPSPHIEETFTHNTSVSHDNSSPGPTPSPKLPSLPSHRKSCSVDSTTNIPSPHVTSRRVTPISSSPFLPEALSSPPNSLPHSPHIPPNPLIQLTDHRDAPLTVPQSPIKLEGPNAFGDGAVNARTERKVLDLEISNSSLLAINRTLERELRKQNAELRRFRRLSRSGRLSITTSVRSTSGAGLSVVSENEDVSELSSIYSNDELSEESDQDSFADDGTISPNSLAENDPRHRVDDEKRFMLDLAKHQELLIDSQKLNQSLKRCIGWTEELIKEGKKALEYNVHVNDIEIGGRVLAPDELEEELGRGRGLLSPAAEVKEDFNFDLTSEAVDMDL